MSSLLLQVSSASLRGRESPLNEDALFYVAGPGEGRPADEVARHGCLLAVSDGGGGPLAGPVLQALTRFYYGQMGQNVAENLRRAIHEANVTAQGAGTAVQAAPAPAEAPFTATETRDLRAGERAALAETVDLEATQKLDDAAPPPAADTEQVRTGGATLAAVVVKDDLLYVANVGDSRAYLLREQKLWPLTRDQVDDAGRPTRLLGVSPFLEPDIFLPLALDVDDRLLICSDGLTDALRNDEALTRLVGKRPLSAAAADLVDAAREAGGQDDVSAIVAELQAPRLVGGLSRVQLAVLAVLGCMALLLFLWFLLELWWTIR